MFEIQINGNAMTLSVNGKFLLDVWEDGDLVRVTTREEGFGCAHDDEMELTWVRSCPIALVADAQLLDIAFRTQRNGGGEQRIHTPWGWEDLRRSPVIKEDKKGD